MARKPAASRKRPAAKKAGRPSHKPTQQMRSQVRAFAGFGVPQRQIAMLLGLSINTLRKHYAEDIEVGDAQATAAVSRTLYNKALAGEGWAVCFWMKARAGWSEKVPDQKVKHSGEVQHEHSGEVVLTAEQRASVLAAVRARALEDPAPVSGGTAGGL